MSFLSRFIEEKRELIASGRWPARPLAPRASAAPRFEWPGFGVIAELKRASPAKGAIANHPLAEWAPGLASGGARALSVLTEPRYFGGSLADLAQVSSMVPTTPCLRKDFIIEAFELDEAVAAGAAAVLLIVAGLGEEAFTRLYHEATARGLRVLAEVHAEAELETALACPDALIGINQRDLETLVVDERYAEKLAPLIPRGRDFVVESGIRDAEDVRWARALGAKGVLVGEALSRAPDPGARLAEWLRALAW